MSAAQSLKRIVRRAGIRRSTVAAARMRCERVVLSYAGRRNEGPRPRILCYHSVGTPRWGVNDVSPARFRRQIERALAAGYRFVPAAEIARADVPTQAPLLAVTFDDGLRSVLDHAAPVLRTYGIPWTIFVVSDWASGQHRFGEGTMLDWRDLERVAAAGGRIGSHSVSHPDFARLEPGTAANELARSREAIRAHLGLDVTEFAIPFGQSMNWTPAAQQAALEAGYTTVYAQSEDRRPPGTVARTFVTRFDGDRIFDAALGGAYDRWEEWV